MLGDTQRTRNQGRRALAEWCRTLIAAILIPFALVVAFVLVLLWSRKNRESWPTMIEYWVYLPEAKLPPQEALMTAMVADNPHSKPGRPAIGAQEGMLFTDVRTHMIVAKRSKNPHIFRPDLFDTQAEPTAAILERLSAAQAIAKISFVSEVPVRDKRHLQFIPHMADAVARLAGGTVIFDRTAERLYTSEDFFAMLEQNTNVASFDFHCRVVWTSTIAGGKAETRGLQKVGMRDIQSDEAPSDQQSLVVSVVHEAGLQAWDGQDLGESVEVPLYGDTFDVRLRRERGSELLHAHISRIAVRG